MALTEAEQFDLALVHLSLAGQSILGAASSLQSFAETVGKVMEYMPTDEQMSRLIASHDSLVRACGLLEDAEKCLIQTATEGSSDAVSTVPSQPSSTDNDSTPSSKRIGFASY